MRKLLYISLFVILLSCAEDECDVKFSLNEFGGQGKNEVTFLVDNKSVFHSNKIKYISTGGSSFLFKLENPYHFYIRRVKEIKNGKVIKDSLGNDIYKDYYELKIETPFSSECENHIFYHYEFDFKFIGFNDNVDTIIDSDISLYNNYRYEEDKPGYSNYYSYSDFKAKIYINRIDSIIYGSFEGTLYEYEGLGFNKTKIDSIYISNGTFDFRFNHTQIHDIY